MAIVLAIDAGTTGVRTVAIDDQGHPGAFSYREFPQHFPRPGWVEHDADDIWRAVHATLADVVAQVDAVDIAAIGITNQRETVVAWDRATGRPLHRALVWQDRRTADRCAALRDAGAEPLVRARTGLVLDPYFSATKLEWLFTHGGITPTADLAVGTVDAWILWNLTGGTDGGVHATEASNASRTLLFDIDALAWSEELCALFGVPSSCLPAVQPSSGRFGTTRPAAAAGLSVPVSGIAGDQQAALFGQACFEPGMAKNTYGTGSFVLVNAGTTRPPAVDGVLTTVAWTRADTVTYALEGSIFVTGAAIQWLRDGLGLLDAASDAGPLAASVADTGGVVFVPALTGLGAPWWDPYARGAIVGITRGTTRAHLVRATVEAMAWQTADVVDAISASGQGVSELRVDGGAAAMDVLCQFQADVLGVTVRRPSVLESTALGAAFLAGLAEGVWDSPADAASAWHAAATFAPAPLPDRDARQAEWHRGVERSRDWARDD
ncbi:MAG TPA: glycerol kinase GlpK [Acidimicrobiia bacterium]|nr:glycerol kinase GlpK [Acidimicrobiia bacterium]